MDVHLPGIIESGKSQKERDESKEEKQQLTEDGYVTVENRRNKRKTLRLREGNAVDLVGLETCEPRPQYVSAVRVEGLRADYLVQGLRDWLVGKGIVVQAVFKVRTSGQKSVFCIVPQKGDYAKCSSEEFWPKGILFRR